MSKGKISQAGNKITGTIHNTGIGFFGANLNVGGNFVLSMFPSASHKIL